MNVKLLRAVAAKILEEPRQFDMVCFFRTGPDVPNCGTAACIAGWAIALSHKLNPKEASELRQFKGDEVVEANKILRLPKGAWSKLFYYEDWPEPFLFQFETAESNSGKAKVAAKRISHFIRTKGAE